jgi:hypothetical protein
MRGYLTALSDTMRFDRSMKAWYPVSLQDNNIVQNKGPRELEHREPYVCNETDASPCVGSVTSR